MGQKEKNTLWKPFQHCLKQDNYGTRKKFDDQKTFGLNRGLLSKLKK